jgi:competence protein ComEA
MEKRTLQKLGLLCASVALCSAASWWNGNEEADRQVQKIAEQPVAEQVQEIKITVCVSGAVAKPGLYEVTKGSRAQQVIELAGGVTDEADMDRVNLAQLCKDGGHIKVPRLSKARLKQKMQERKSAKADVISGEITGDGHYNDAAQNHFQKRAQEKWETADGSQSAATGWPEMRPDGNRREEKTESNTANAVLNLLCHILQRFLHVHHLAYYLNGFAGDVDEEDDHRDGQQHDEADIADGGGKQVADVDAV